MIESEARKKICPHLTQKSRPHGFSEGGHGQEVAVGVSCLGSECMMWEEWREQTPNHDSSTTDQWLRDDKGVPLTQSFDPPQGDCMMKCGATECQANVY